MPVFSVNNSNAAKSSVATFFAPGSYQFTVTITDSSGKSVTFTAVTKTESYDPARPGAAGGTVTNSISQPVAIDATMDELQGHLDLPESQHWGHPARRRCHRPTKYLHAMHSPAR